MNDIPPGPAGQQKFDLCYELDADGILKVTGTHNQTGKQEEVTIDYKSCGKRKEKEINDLVAKAENMKLLDQAEENRILSTNRLKAICNKIKLDAQNKPEEEVENLLLKVENCLDWMKDYPNAHESQVVSQYDQILEDTKEKCQNKNKYV
jgi:molecular chaperone DnaK